MGIRKRVAELERQNMALALELTEIKKRLPEYEEAVAKGVDDVWSKAVASVANYNPFAKEEEVNGR